ncbi:hypothetical protein KEJ47_09640 [Candidatus Bathyarchaeota archaeon]|nr:hypothetical protein [Candidatus Bathyarchaeota archaeon]
MASLEKPYLSHAMRVAMVAELHAKGWSSERIVEAFHWVSDFDESRTRYQVQHILNHGYKPFKCSTIQRLKACLEDKCQIYRRRGKNKDFNII